MKQLIYLVSACLALTTACGGAPEQKEKERTSETTGAETDRPAETPEVVLKDATGGAGDVTSEMMAAFRQFREAMLGKDAVRLQAVAEGSLADNCMVDGDGVLAPGEVIGMLGEAQLEVLKRRTAAESLTDTEKDGCVFRDAFGVNDNRTEFYWSVGCMELLEDDAGEYTTIFNFRKVNGKYRLVEVMCAG